MAAVTVIDHMERNGEWTGRITIATTGDTLATFFGNIVSVQLTPETTTDATTYCDYDISGGTVTFNGAGTGFVGNWSCTIAGK